MRNIVSEMSLDGCLTSREKINTELRKVLDEATDRWGVEVNRIELNFKGLTPPSDIQQAMHKKKAAKHSRR